MIAVDVARTRLLPEEDLMFRKKYIYPWKEMALAAVIGASSAIILVIGLVELAT